MSDAPPANEDRALVVGVAESSDQDRGLVVVRQRSRDAEAELGLVRPLREGKPIHGEVVKLTPRPEAPALCDVEVQHDARPAAAPTPKLDAPHKGPPRVATERYREGWDRVFSSKPN
jgi:hypothetical protein